MKKVLFILLASSTLLACKKDPEAVADFTYYEDGITPGKVVFTNTSTNATTFVWNFGDQSNSSEKNPQHIYAQNGTYKVTLNVTGNKEVSKYVEVNSVAEQGQCVFWVATNTYGEINIKINGGIVGTITQYMTTGLSPECGAIGFVTLDYPEGTYNFTAESTDGNWSWNGSFTIINGECSKKQLT